MAHIIGPDNITIHLKQSHLFGRLPNAVDTYIKEVAVSRLHFLLEYTAPDWHLVEYSRNGTWLNGERVKKGTAVLLKQGDVISIGEKHAIEYTFAYAGAPADILCRRNNAESPIIETLMLQAVNHLPDQQHCELSIRRTDNDWLIEHKHQQRCLQDGDWITIDEQKWQAVLTHDANGTMELQEPPILAELQLQLFTTLDEETTSAKMQSPVSEVDLQVRSHHYLLLLLARQSIKDVQQQLDYTECGWIYMEELMNMLGVPETLINIQIHRARKQFEIALDGLFDGKQLVERRVGKVRLGFKQIVLYKGDHLEGKTV
jgi:hypothetical protein